MKKIVFNVEVITVCALCNKQMSMKYYNENCFLSVIDSKVARFHFHFSFRAMKLNLLTQDMIDDYDPALMFTIPRLAIIWYAIITVLLLHKRFMVSPNCLRILLQVLPNDTYKCVLYFSGLLIYPEGPLNPDMDPMNMSEMFRPFQTLLYKIRYGSEVIFEILFVKLHYTIFVSGTCKKNLFCSTVSYTMRCKKVKRVLIYQCANCLYLKLSISQRTTLDSK